MNYRKIEKALWLRTELFRALRYFAMCVRMGPSQYQNAMFWQLEYLWLREQIDTTEADDTTIDIGRLAMMCNGYNVGEGG